MAMDDRFGFGVPQRHTKKKTHMSRSIACLLLIWLWPGSLSAAESWLRDSTYVKQLTNADNVGAAPGSFDPSLTADGEWILYCDTDDARTSTWRIRRMRLDGSGKETLAEGIAADIGTDGSSAGLKPVESRNGAFIAYASQGHLFVMDRSRTPRRITSTPAVRGPVSWSADGRLAFVQLGNDGMLDVFVLDPETGEENRFRVTSHEADELQSSRWIEGDETIAYASNTGISHLRLSDGEVTHALQKNLILPILDDSAQRVLHLVRRDLLGTPIYARYHQMDLADSLSADGPQLIGGHWWRFGAGPILRAAWSADGKTLVFAIAGVAFRGVSSEVFAIDLKPALAVAPTKVVIGYHRVQSASELADLLGTDPGSVSFAGSLEILNSADTDLPALSTLRRLNGTLRIRNNRNLVSLRSLDSLESQYGDTPSLLDITISGNQELVELPLANLRRARVLTIEGNPVLDAFAPPRLSESTVTISVNHALQDLAFPQLQNGALTVLGNRSLERLSAPRFDGGNLIVSANQALELVEGFGHVDTLWSLRISNNQKLAALPVFRSLRRTHHEFHISKTLLRSLDAFPSLTSVGSIPTGPSAPNPHFAVFDNPALESIEAIPRDIRIETWDSEPFVVRIEGNPLLPRTQVQQLTARLRSTHGNVVVLTRDADNDEPADDVITATSAPPYPNPATDRVHLTIQASGQTKTHVAVYNSAGQLVTELLDGVVSPGSMEVEWDLLGRDGKPVAAGVYLLRVKTEERTETQKVVVLPR